MRKLPAKENVKTDPWLVQTLKSVENLTTQNMDHHQLLMNTEVMKHFTILNRTSVRDIMLQHEKTFKEQVHDLHKLYEVQKLLMHRASSKAVVHPPHEEPNQLKRQRSIWDHRNISSTEDAMTSLTEKPILDAWGSKEKESIRGDKMVNERRKHSEQSPKSTSSPARKRKIDLEQLPEDDTDDEVEKSENVMGSANINLQKDVGSFPNETVPNLKPDSGVEMYALPPKLPGKACQENQLAMSQIKQGIPVNQHSSALNDTSFSLSQYSEESKLCVNVIEAEQKNVMIVNKDDLQKNSLRAARAKPTVMLLPQPDLCEGVANGTTKHIHLHIQGSEARTSMAVVSSSQQKQELMTQPFISKPLINQAQQIEIHDEVHQGLPEKKPIHEEDSLISVGKRGRASGDKRFQGMDSGPQEGVLSYSSQKEPQREDENGSKWFPPALYSQGGQLATAVPALGVDLRVSDGHAAPNFIVTTNNTGTATGCKQDLDTNFWYQQNPFMQFSQYQQQNIFPPPVFPSANQAVRFQSSQNINAGLYPQVVYGIRATNAPQVGLVAEGLRRDHGEVSGPWNMLGLGYHYPNIPPVPPTKPPFKKPPKLVLTNDGISMELKLVSPERESNEKPSQGKSSHTPKKDQMQESSKLRNRKDDTVKRETQTASSMDPRQEKVKVERSITERKIQSPTTDIGKTQKDFPPLKEYAAHSDTGEALHLVRNAASLDIKDSLPTQDKASLLTAFCQPAYGNIIKGVDVRIHENIEADSIPSDKKESCVNLVPGAIEQDCHNASDPPASLPRLEGEPKSKRQAEDTMTQHAEDSITVITKPRVEERGIDKKTLCKGNLSAHDVRDDCQIEEYIQGVALSGQGSSSGLCKDDEQGSLTGGTSRTRNHCDSELVGGSATSLRGSWKTQDMRSPSHQNSAMSTSSGQMVPQGSGENTILTSKFYPNGPEVQVVSAPRPQEKSMKDSENLPLEPCYPERTDNHVADKEQIRSERNEAKNCGIPEVKSADILGIKSNRPQETDASKRKLSIERTLDVEKFAQASTDHSQSDSPTSSDSVANANSELPQRIGSKYDGPGLDLVSSGSHLNVQAVSTRSNRTDLLGNFRAEVKCPSEVLETSAWYRESAKGSSSSSVKCKLPATATSGETCVPLPSIKPETSKSQQETTVEASGDVLNHASDNDNLAATILMSFAPMQGLQSQRKQMKDDEKRIAEPSMLKPSEYSVRRTDMASHSKSKKESKIGTQRKSKKLDYFESLALTMKHKSIAKRQSSELQSDSEGQEAVRVVKSKLGRPTEEDQMDGVLTTTSTSMQEKHLHKVKTCSVSGENLESDRATNHMGNDAFHSRTGRRTSRTSTTAHLHGSKGRPQQQSQQHTSEQERGDSPSKPKVTAGTKPWGSSSQRKRCTSRPRSQFPEIPRKMT